MNDIEGPLPMDGLDTLSDGFYNCNQFSFAIMPRQSSHMRKLWARPRVGESAGNLLKIAGRVLSEGCRWPSAREIGVACVKASDVGHHGRALEPQRAIVALQSSLLSPAVGKICGRGISLAGLRELGFDVKLYPRWPVAAAPPRASARRFKLPARRSTRKPPETDQDFYSASRGARRPPWLKPPRPSAPATNFPPGSSRNLTGW